MLFLLLVDTISNNFVVLEANRRVLESKTKTFQVPYIVDPNTGVSMFESAEIVKYLDATYTKK